MVQTSARQRGLTLVSLVIVLALIALITMVVLKLTPVYLEGMAVSDAVDSLSEGGQSYTPGEIRDTLAKRFNVNQVSSVDKSDIAVERSRTGGYLVRVDYEVRVPFLSNVDFLVSFENGNEVAGR